MNYYAFHVGDYSSATRHLSMLEHGAYRLLLDVYYTRECPFPPALRDVCRLVAARGRQEEQAVRSVLEEFFTLTDDGWRHERCDAEIARANEKKAKASQSASARWSNAKRPTDGQGPHSDGNANAYANAPPNAPPNAMRTHSDGNAPKPKPNSSLPSVESAARAPECGPPNEPTQAGMACRLMREAGATGVNPSDPRLLQLLAQQVTPRQLGDLAAELRDRGKAPSMAYVVGTMAGRLRDAAEQPPAPPGAAGRVGKAATGFGAEIDRISSAIDRARGVGPSPETIDVEARRVG